MLSQIIYSLSFKMIYIVYLGQKRGGGARAPWAPPSKSPTGRVSTSDQFSGKILHYRVCYAELIWV